MVEGEIAGVMDAVSLSGFWYLTGASADERSTPAHRVVIRFDVVAGHLRGAALFPGQEVPLRDLAFDGKRLSFTLEQPSGAGQHEPVTILPYPLVLEAVSENKFEGSWKSRLESVGIPLKLWRAYSWGDSTVPLASARQNRRRK